MTRVPKRLFTKHTRVQHIRESLAVSLTHSFTGFFEAEVEAEHQLYLKFSPSPSLPFFSLLPTSCSPAFILLHNHRTRFFAVGMKVEHQLPLSHPLPRLPSHHSCPRLALPHSFFYCISSNLCPLQMILVLSSVVTSVLAFLHTLVPSAMVPLAANTTSITNITDELNTTTIAAVSDSATSSSPTLAVDPELLPTTFWIYLIVRTSHA